MSNSDQNLEYWSRLIRQLRDSLNLSQEQMAQLLNTNQGTVSRWERGTSTPLFQTRREIVLLAKNAGLATLDDIMAIVTFSPFPMILVSSTSMVIAASASSGFQSGMTTFEQTPEVERAHLESFNRDIAASGFWKRECEKLTYEFAGDDGIRRAVLTPVSMLGEIYALVQKDW